MNGAAPRTLLVVAGEFPPIKSIGRIRTVKFVEYLSSNGWNVIVITVQPNGTSLVADPALTAEIPPQTVVRRISCPDIEASIARVVKRFLGRRTSGVASGGVTPEANVQAEAHSKLFKLAHVRFKRIVNGVAYVPDSYNLWAWRAAAEAIRICKERRIDAVYTTLPPFSAAWVGFQIKRRFELPWIVDYRDLWTGDVLREWMGPIRRAAELWLERRLIGGADVVAAVSEQKTAFLRRLHARSAAHFITLTNGYDPEEFAGISRARPLVNDTVEFIFTGRLFKNRRGYAFAEALGQLKEERPELSRRARARFLGGVAPEIREQYRNVCARYGIENQIEFAGDVPHEQAKRAQVNADYLLLIVDTGVTSDGVIPGKLFEYVAAGRPIFALTGAGATADIIQKGRLGRVVPVEDVGACKAALREVLAGSVPERLDVDANYLRQFDRKVIAAEFGRLLDELCMSRVPP